MSTVSRMRRARFSSRSIGRLRENRARRSLATWTTPPRRVGTRLMRARPEPEEDSRRNAPHPCYERLSCPVEPQRRRHGPVRPDPGRRLRLRRQRVLHGHPAPAAAEGRLQEPPGDAGERARPRSGARRRRRLRHEGMGDGAGLYPLHALVPAAHRIDRREARLVLQPDRRRQRAGRVLGQGADPGRAGRVVVPDRRHPGDVRGPRLHGVGPVLAGVHPREPERRAALHPDRVRVVDRRGARPQDPAAALDGRAVALGAARAEAARQRGRRSACSRRSGPSRSTS